MRRACTRLACAHLGGAGVGRRFRAAHGRGHDKCRGRPPPRLRGRLATRGAQQSARAAAQPRGDRRAERPAGERKCPAAGSAAHQRGAERPAGAGQRPPGSPTLLAPIRGRLAPPAAAGGPCVRLPLCLPNSRVRQLRLRPRVQGRSRVTALRSRCSGPASSSSVPGPAWAPLSGSTSPCRGAQERSCCAQATRRLSLQQASKSETRRG
jgi:hypothetical protein